MQHEIDMHMAAAVKHVYFFLHMVIGSSFVDLASNGQQQPLMSRTEAHTDCAQLLLPSICTLFVYVLTGSGPAGGICPAVVPHVPGLVNVCTIKHIYLVGRVEPYWPVVKRAHVGRVEPHWPVVEHALALPHGLGKILG